MKQNYQRELEELYEEYLDLSKHREYYSAFQRIAEISNCIINKSLDSELMDLWKNKLDSINLNTQIVDGLIEGMSSDLLRIHRVLSIGHEFDDDEIMLVITLRAQVGLMKEYLASKNIGVNVETINVDRELRELKNSEPKLYFQCFSNMLKNWGLPVDLSVIN